MLYLDKARLDLKGKQAKVNRGQDQRSVRSKAEVGQSLAPFSTFPCALRLATPQASYLQVGHVQFPSPLVVIQLLLLRCLQLK